MYLYFSFKEFMKNPQLMIPFLDLFAGLCGVGMIESMLEPHLRESGASTMGVGLSFLAFGFCHMAGAMLLGQVTTDVVNPSCF